MDRGGLCIVLHAHLPYVHHPEYEHFFEERWLFEAITECYLPLLNMCERLNRDRVRYRLTLSLSPTLLTMLNNELLQQRYVRHLQGLIRLAEQEISRTRKQAEYQYLARLYRRNFKAALQCYRQDYDCDLVAAFKKQAELGGLELITCAATHGFLPLLNVSESAVRNQINMGVETFKQCFGFVPKGFWLPECGYYPGLEIQLDEAGLGYFFVDSHALTQARPQAECGVYAPIACANGVAAFARDPESSRQVWSAQEGYPGDGDYREYHCDIGYDSTIPESYLAPYLLEETIRVPVGIKYQRVTGGGGPKAAYRPRQALMKARQHAQDFYLKRQRQLDDLSYRMGKAPIIVAPYDAELFGHWWFEGPQWLEFLLRLVGGNKSGMQLVSGSDYLSRFQHLQTATPSASSWGEQGYSGYWLNETNAWIYPVLHKSAMLMEELAEEFQQVPRLSLEERALNQAARSLLLAQASDWPFIMKSGTTVEYAKKRILDHLARFNYLQESVRTHTINEHYLTALEVMDDIFPMLDFRTYKTQPRTTD
ncbi:MAG: DUF1957 domain-containing protein [Gammaproteobacteria bacterium]|uniref:glycoside hydrolase family 57 protein n=1 Tax=Methylotuvimicrobium sp. TaxID=2822413 RepID=UPI001DBEB3C4|nr:DUF1957 domain-containing protein [Gammaproteobacteria bacterium]